MDDASLSRVDAARTDRWGEAGGDGDHPALAEARGLEGAGDVAGALRALDAALDGDGAEVALRREAFWLSVRANRAADALRHARALADDFPERAEGYLFLGNLQALDGDLDAAIDTYTRGIEACPGTLELIRGRGDAELRAERLAAAQASYHQALRLAPRDPQSHCDVARLRQAQRRFSDAFVNFDRALALDAEHLPSLLALGGMNRSLLQWDEAEALFRRAAEGYPDSPQAVASLGSVLLKKGDLEGGREAVERALAMAPDFPESLSLLGALELQAGNYERAGPMLESAAARQPDSADLQYNLSLYLLTMGRLKEGWRAWEHGLDTEQRRIDWPFPRWRGEPLGGTTVYICAEQGLGDEVMFAQCIPDFRARFRPARVVVGCDPRLAGLYSRAWPDLEVVGLPRIVGPGPLAERGHIDYQVAIGSLPVHVRARRQDFTRPRAFFSPEPALAAELGRRLHGLGDGFKVGISWRGGAVPMTRQFRTVELPHWAPLLTLPGVRFVNLQYGDSAADIDQVRELLGVTVHDVGLDLMGDIEGVCALAGALDLVVSVDNSTVHLAGAVGAPVWVIVPGKPDWRWLLDGEDTDWYASLRLLRRRRDEAVDALMERVAAELAERAGA